MSRARFDSSQLLPLFQILSLKSTTNVNTMDETTESKTVINRKKSKNVGVPVHTSQTTMKPERKPSILKLRKSKHKHDKVQHQNEELPTKDKTPDVKSKVSRHDILLENEKLFAENQKIIKKLAAVETILSKKETAIARLQEKLAAMKQHVAQVSRENQQIEKENNEFSIRYEQLKNQLQVKCTNCELFKKTLHKSTEEISDVKTINQELNRDMDMLKNVIYRLNVQLERYQQKSHNNTAISSHTHDIQTTTEEQNDEPVKLSKTNDIALHSDHIHTPISWGSVNVHTLGPLLDAYQETINEKEGIISNYQAELTTFTSKFKMILDENELLHKRIIEDRDTKEKYSFELINNRKELKTVKEQNDLLVKKCSVKQDKVQDVCKVYDHKLESFQRDRDILQEEYHKAKVDLFALQENYERVTRDHEALLADKRSVIPLEVHNLAVNECKRLFEELKSKYDLEKNKLSNRVKHFEEQLDELDKKLVEQSAEKREMQIKLKTTEKQLRKAEHKFSESQSALTHVKISRDCCKRQLAKAVEFGKELVSEQESLVQQLSHKQKENKAVKQIGSSIVNRMDVLKTQLKSVQKNAFHQLESVEQRIQEQDSSIETMRRSHETELERMARELKEKDEYIAKLLEQNHTLPGTQYLLYREKHMHLS